MIEPGGGTILGGGIGAGIGAGEGAVVGGAAGGTAGWIIMGKAGRWADDKLGYGDQSRCGGNCAAAQKAEDEKKKGEKPPNKAPEGSDRDQALDAAKKANNISDNEQLEIRENYGNNPTSDSKEVPRSENLNYLDKDGNVVTLRNDYGGHNYPDDPTQDRGPHINDPADHHYDYQGSHRNIGPSRK